MRMGDLYDFEGFSSFKASTSNNYTSITSKQKLDFVSFTNAYESMKNESKWKLTSGKVVEDSLYEFGLKCMDEHLSHSFILDTEDISYINEGIFNESEMKEIRDSKVQNLPVLPDDLLDYIVSFEKNNIQELRQTLDKPYSNSTHYNRELHHDFDWFKLVMHSLIREYESGSLKEEHLENWYNIHLWGPIIDQCFSNISDMEMVRSESASVTSGLRKNVGRTIAGKSFLTRWKIGRKGDLIIRTAGNLEFGSSEAGRFFKSEKGTKWMVESGLKLPKMLKDMLVQLASEVNWSKPILQKIRTVGFVHGGSRLMTVELDCPEGYVCRMRRSQIFKVADSVLTHSRETLPLLSAIVKECLNMILNNVEDQDESECECKGIGKKCG
ncbi:15661_t:CDS:2, partial [Entrophospora sp. SA101]